MKSDLVWMGISVVCLWILPFVWVLVGLTAFHAEVPAFHLRDGWWDPTFLIIGPGLVIGLVGLVVFPSSDTRWKEVLWRVSAALVYVPTMAMGLFGFMMIAGIGIWGVK